MNGVEFSFSAESNTVIATVSPSECDASLEADLVKKSLQKSEFGRFYINEDAINSLVATAKNASGEGNSAQITVTVGEVKDVEIQVKVQDDGMLASIKIVGAYGGKAPKLANFQNALAVNGILRGWSLKQLKALVEIAKTLSPGRTHKEIIAKGLPPRKGKNTRLKPLVENALDRVLKPKETEDNKVDMRDLGEIICVKQGQAVAQILPPSPGRIGYKVTNEKIIPEPGDKVEMSLGSNTEIDKTKKNVVVACVEGLPKFIDGVMSVDNTFVSNGVNVRTGNVNFEGSIIVNGDVTENMKIESSGDVTINGFVESAFIQAGGDIIITQGVLGKPDDDKGCKLIAKGDVAIEHGQGISIESGGTVRVMKQIAHSDIASMGQILIGRGDQPQGTVLGCKIKACGLIEAGNVGAVSGSKLDIDYSDGFNKINQRLDGLRDMRKELARTNADHEIQYAQFKNKEYSPETQQKVNTLALALEEERELLLWLQTVEQQNMDSLAAYQQGAKVIARQVLHSGVTVRLNKQSYVSDKERPRVCIHWRDHEWKMSKIKS